MYSLTDIYVIVTHNMSDNNLTSIKMNACVDFQHYSITYIIPSLGVIGMLLNILAIVVFSKTKSTTIKGDMTKYLIAKLIFDICYSLCKLFPLFRLYCPECLYGMNFRLRYILKNHFSSFQCIKNRRGVGLGLRSP